jgi:glycerol kinase
MRRHKYVLALDLGTTGNRAIVFDRRQSVVRQEYSEFPQIYPRPGWVEHDPDAIWNSVKLLLSKVFRKIPSRDIASIGVTNQRETVLLWDRKTGRPLHRAIVWQDRRTASACQDLRKRKLGPMIHRKTGLVIDPYFSASKIAWLLDHVKGARLKAEQGKAAAGTIDSWIIWNLTGGRTHVTDPSNGSRTMLFDIRRRTWDQKLCRLFRVPPALLPRVVPSSGEAGVTDKKLFGVEIPIAGIVGDQQGASFAQGCFKPGVVKNTYGTGLFALENTGRTPRFSKNLLTTICWSIGSLDNIEYAVEGSVFIGGAAIQWLRDGLRVLRSSGDSAKLAASIAGNDGVYFVPALVGLGAPYWDPNARGAIVGLTRGTTRAHLVRAAIEAIGYQTRDILTIMREAAHTPFKILRVDGGAAINDFLMQFQADILGIPVERPKVLETTALGAAGLAGIAVGFWRNREEFSGFRKVDRVFYPKMKRARADALYADWLRAVERSRNWERS